MNLKTLIQVMYKCPNITFFFYFLLELGSGHPHRWEFPHVYIGTPTCRCCPARPLISLSPPTLYAKTSMNRWSCPKWFSLLQENKTNGSFGKRLKSGCVGFNCHNRKLRGLFVLRDMQMDMMWPLAVTSHQDVTPVDVVKKLYCTIFLVRINFFKQKIVFWNILGKQIRVHYILLDAKSNHPKTIEIFFFFLVFPSSQPLVAVNKLVDCSWSTTLGQLQQSNLSWL